MGSRFISVLDVPVLVGSVVDNCVELFDGQAFAACFGVCLVELADIAGDCGGVQGLVWLLHVHRKGPGV